jgi:predicted Co/Zn/Cd cation transporter (cation efflux family)
VIEVQRPAHTLFAGLFALLGAFVTLLALGVFFLGSRAPDAVYGDEMSFPEGIALFLVAVSLYQGNRRTSLFAALMAVVSAIAPLFDAWTLSTPYAICWAGIWACVFAVAFRPPPKAQSVTLKEATP